MKPFVAIVLVLCIYLSGSDSAVLGCDVPKPSCDAPSQCAFYGASVKGLEGKSLIFPKRTSTSYIRVFQRHFSRLTAFTICFRAASDAYRDYSLVSYATNRHHNELLIWQTTSGWVSLYLRYYYIQFPLPQMNAILRHICLTWESRTGAVAFWVNGERGLQKHGKTGLYLKGGGQFILGQEQDSVGGGFSSRQSFVGEMTNFNMWSYVLKPREILLVSHGCCGIGGNIINWGRTRYTAAGNVRIEDNMDCKL